MIPALRRAMHPLHDALIGSPKWRYWRELERTQWLPLETLQATQWQRLQALVAFVHASNAFYRRRMDEHGLRPEQFRSPEDLRRLPVLGKPEIRAHMEEMLSEGYRPESLLTFKTGGSTGKPLTIRLTEDCSERRNACAWRHDRWSGWEIGEPAGALWGSPPLPRTIKERTRHALLSPTIYLDTMTLSEATAGEFARQWRATQPTLLFGHAHSLYQLALLIEGAGIAGIEPRGIISTSMSLVPHERRKIEQVFGRRVFDRYGCEEVSLIGSECAEHKGMHLNIEHLWIEFLDDSDQPVEDGMPGRIVVTDLQNLAMPLIRYEVEDVGAPSSARCPCGRGLPLMAEVSGRLADFLVRRDGSRVAGISLIERTVTAVPGISQLQVIQESPYRIRLRVARESQDTGGDLALTAFFRAEFGDDTEVIIDPVASIPAEPSGKYRFTICRVDEVRP